MDTRRDRVCEGNNYYTVIPPPVFSSKTGLHYIKYLIRFILLPSDYHHNMAKVPKELSVVQKDEDYTIVVNHFDGNIMSFQLICVALPLTCWLIYAILSISAFLFIPLLLLAATILWIVRSAKDKTTMLITDEQFEVREGWMQTTKFCLDITDISGTRIHIIDGKTYSSVRTSSYTKTKPIYELMAQTSKGEILVTRHLGYHSQLYIKDILDSRIRRN